ncbi:MAG: gliding motility lipoprotein GldH [Bacteroidota bacterium]
MHFSKRLFFLLVLLSMFASCAERFDQEVIHKIDDDIWKYQETLDFDFKVDDTTALYTFFMDIDHSIDYPFQNLYTKIQTTYPDAEVKEDVLSFELCDDFGLWQGKCRGELCKVRVPLQTKARFKSVGDYTLSFEQYTRRDSLSGLRQLALRVVKE